MIDLIKQAAIENNDTDLFQLAQLLEKDAGTRETVQGFSDLKDSAVSGFRNLLSATGEKITQKTITPGVTKFRSPFFKRLARTI